LALRQHAGEVDGERGGADAALGAYERVDLAELAFADSAVTRVPLEATHRIAEFGALDGLEQKFVGSGPHTLDHGLAVGVKVADHDEEVGYRLFYLLHCLDGAVGIARDIHDEAGAGMTLQILHDANVEIGGYFLILSYNLRFRQVDDAVTNVLAKMFVA